LTSARRCTPLSPLRGTRECSLSALLISSSYRKTARSLPSVNSWSRFRRHYVNEPPTHGEQRALNEISNQVSLCCDPLGAECRWWTFARGACHAIESGSVLVLQRQVLPPFHERRSTRIYPGWPGGFECVDGHGDDKSLSKSQRW